MIRVTFGKKGIDKRGKRNIEECIRLNIPFGVYLYSYALNLQDAVQEANLLIMEILDYKDYVKYMCIDMEDADFYKKKNGFPTQEMLCDIIKCECNIFESRGFTPLVYASSYWFKTYLNSRALDSIPKWIAWWDTKEENINKEKYIMWQHTSKGKVGGINGNVDLNVMFTDKKENNILDDLKNYPEYAVPTLEKLINKKALSGENGKINLDENSVRIFVILDRLGLI